MSFRSRFGIETGFFRISRAVLKRGGVAAGMFQLRVLGCKQKECPIFGFRVPGVLRKEDADAMKSPKSSIAVNRRARAVDVRTDNSSTGK